MFKQKQWLTSISAFLILLFFLSIYWNMKQVAVYEQGQLQEEFQGIQVQIADQVTKGYEKGNNVVMALNRSSTQDNLSINIKLLDQMLKGKSSAEALAYTQSYLEGGGEHFILYDNQFKVQLSSSDAPLEMTRDVLKDWTNTLKPGESLSKSAFMMKVASGANRPRVLFYKMANQPWLICAALNDNQESQSASMTAQLIKERFSKLNSNMTSDLVYIDNKGLVKRSSRPELLGQTLKVGSEVALSQEQNLLLNNNKDKGFSLNNGQYTWLSLTDASGKVQKYVGRYLWSDIEKCYYLTDARLFSEENMIIGKYLGIGVMINVVLAIMIVKLVVQNYEYYIEGKFRKQFEAPIEIQEPNREQHKLGFIIMAIFLVEIIGLVQGIFSAQAIKYELERKLEVDSEQLLQQFKASFDMTEDIQNFLEQFSQRQIDAGLVSCYKSLDAVSTTWEPPVGGQVNYFSQNFRVFLKENNRGTQSMLNHRFGISAQDLSPYKVMTYETHQDGEVSNQSRMLLGISSNGKWLIEIDFDKRQGDVSVQMAQKEMTDILNNAYYFNENTGNFYVFGATGKVMYQGGFEKNGQYFSEIDLNSNKSLIDLIKKNQETAIRVIYKAGEQTKRSLLYADYDSVEDEYYVYEQDQSKRFLDIDRIYKFVWILGVGLLLATFGTVWLVWERAHQMAQALMRFTDES